MAAESRENCENTLEKLAAVSQGLSAVTLVNSREGISGGEGLRERLEVGLNIALTIRDHVQSKRQSAATSASERRNLKLPDSFIMRERISFISSVKSERRRP